MNDHAHDEHAHHDAGDGHGHVHQPMDYASLITAIRGEKDGFFKESHHSPIPASDRPAFNGLPYYPIEPALRFAPIALEPLGDGVSDVTQVQTSDGAVRDGRFVGTFSFEVDGETQRLVALRLEGAQGDALFVPFKDATSGPETYGAGRYLDLDPLEDGTYDLDFNVAYAPFCAYAPEYSCPLPPPENWLKVPIKAGERNL
jgi:uncharacterized protein (DUF1684 family)